MNHPLVDLEGTDYIQVLVGPEFEDTEHTQGPSVGPELLNTKVDLYLERSILQW